MSTPDTNNIGIKLQSAGENLNTWGDPNLNNDLIVGSNLSSKWNNVTINGDTTVSETNYSTTNDTEVAVIKFVTGTVVAAFNYIIPGRKKRLSFWNSTAYTATVKLSATTGVAIPAGYMALLATDGVTDVTNIAPQIFAGAITVAGQIHGVTAGIANTDAANVAQVAAAIAAASLPAGTGAVLNSMNDTTPNYLAAKTSGSKAVTASTTNPSGNEVRDFSVEWGALANGGTKTSGFTAASNTKYVFNMSAAGTILLPLAPTVGDIVQFAISGGYALTLDPNGGKINGSTSTFIYPPGEYTDRVTYTGSTRGWV